MTGLMYFDKDGKPLELMEWAELRLDRDYARIELTELKRGYVVSTIWFGINMNITDFGGPPFIFETATLRNGIFIEVFGRCATVEDAKMLHNKCVRQLKAAAYLKRMKRRNQHD